MSKTFRTSYDDINFQSNSSRRILPLILVISGTGGMMTNNSAYQFPIWIHDSSMDVKHPMSQVLPDSPMEQLKLIREAFSLNISELANILNVTRPTVYSWLQGKDLKAEALTRIARLSKMAKELEILNIQRIDTLIHRPIFDNISLFDKLKRNEEIISILSVLKEISDKESSARLKLKGSGNNKKLSDPSDYSMPLYPD